MDGTGVELGLRLFGGIVQGGGEGGVESVMSQGGAHGKTRFGCESYGRRHWRSKA